MNFEQSDIDGDRRGDVCDDCPLLANPAGGSDVDGDEIADVCDPHPTTADCLAIVDSFRDPTAFAANWVVAEGTAAPQDGHVVLDATTTAVTIITNGTTGLMDVMVLGDVIGDATASIQAISGRQAMESYGCELNAPNDLSANGPGDSISVFADLIPPSPINRRFLLRLVTLDTRTQLDPVIVACRVDYGISVGTDVRGMNARLSGGAGVRAGFGASTIDGVAITHATTTTCPPTVFR